MGSWPGPGTVALSILTFGVTMRANVQSVASKCQQLPTSQGFKTIGDDDIFEP